MTTTTIPTKLIDELRDVLARDDRSEIRVVAESILDAANRAAAPVDDPEVLPEVAVPRSAALGPDDEYGYWSRTPERADAGGVDLDELERVVGAMTRGPWKAKLDVFDAEGEGIVATFTDEQISFLGSIPTDLTYPVDDAYVKNLTDAQWAKAKAGPEIMDACGIVALRNAAPALIAMARRAGELERQIATLPAGVTIETACEVVLRLHEEAADAMTKLDEHEVRLARVESAAGKRIAALETGLREAVDRWDDQDVHNLFHEEREALRALLPGRKETP